MVTDVYFRLDLTPCFLPNIKLYTPKDYIEVSRYVLIEVIDFTWDAVMRGGFLPDTTIVDDCGLPVLPDELFEPFMDANYECLSNVVETLPGYESGSVIDNSNKWKLTNVLLKFDNDTNLPTSISALVLGVAHDSGNF